MTRLINEIWSCKTYINMQQLMSILRKIRCNIAMKASSLGARVTARSLQSVSISWHSCNDPIISSSLCWGLAHYNHWLKGHIFVHKERVPWHYLCSAERKVEEDHQEDVQGTGWCQDWEVHLYLVTLSSLPYQEEEEWKIFATDF